ncbi:MAG: efflux RND transporter periplasmic adaptor subunit [Alkaliphilus sp.]
MTKSKKKIVIIVFVIIFLIAVIATAVFMGNKEKGEKAIFVTATNVEIQDLESTVFTSGRIIAKEARTITPNTSGKLVELLVEEGNSVVYGQVLARLDSSDIHKSIESTQIQLNIEGERLNQLLSSDTTHLEIAIESAKKIYEDSKSSYENKKKLFDIGSISEQELNSIKNTLDRAYNDLLLSKRNYDNFKTDLASQQRIQRLSINSIANNLENMKDELIDFELLSPIDGVITKVFVEELAIVNQATAIFLIENLENMQVITHISEFDIKNIEIGQIVKITSDSVSKNEYVGKVSNIASRAETINTAQGQETVVEITINLQNESKLFKPNLTAQVEIVTASAKNVIAVPYEAIFIDGEGNNIVFTVVDSRAVSHHVKTGIGGDLVIQVISDSIVDGDQILLNPTEDTIEGMLVRTIEGNN